MPEGSSKRFSPERQQTLDNLAKNIMALKRNHTVRVAIDGVDGAGKSTLVKELHPILKKKGAEVIVASIDGFHNPSTIRHRKGKLSPEGYYQDSFNYDSLMKKLLDPLGPVGSGQYQTVTFNYRTDAEVKSEKNTVNDNAILIFDGVFLLRSKLKEYWDYSIFIHVDFETVLDRVSNRDQDLFGSSEQVVARYSNRYIPGQQLYLKSVKPHLIADIVLDNNDFEAPLIADSKKQKKELLDRAIFYDSLR